MHAVIETEDFAADAKALNLSDDERFDIIKAIAADPKKGDMIKGTGGARKLRFAGKGKGKSGAYRVVTYYAADDVPVFLLSIFSKGEKIDLTQGERNTLKKILGGIAEDYRKSVKAKLTRLMEKRK